MLIVYADNGGERRDGQNCFVWEGLPPLHTIVRQLQDSPVHGMRIEVARPDLPVECINTYQVGIMHGSYDGALLMVQAECAERLHSGERFDHLTNTYRRLRQFFMDIVHGHVQGETAVQPQQIGSSND